MGSRKYRIHTRSRAKAGLVSKFLVACRVGPRGGCGEEFFVADPWLSKGFWILYYRHKSRVYRIWTATRERGEVLAWLRWFESEAFRKEHEQMLQRDMMCHRARLWKIRSWSRPKRLARQKLLTSGRHPSFCFTTNPQHPAEGVWLGWRQRVLRTSPADHIPGWLENYSRQGCAIQCYKVSHILRNSGGNHVSLRRLADLQKAVTSDLERRYIF